MKLFRTLWNRSILIRFVRIKGALLGLLVVCFFVSFAIAGPLIYSVSPFSPAFNPFEPPFGANLLGTDDLGRDTLAQLTNGTRISLIVGFSAAASAVLIGIVVGSISGYKGGHIDSLLMRITDIVLMIPSFILLIVVLTVFGSSILKIILFISVLYWPKTARLIRAEYLSLKQRDFVVAARIIGLPDRDIIFREILPNALSSVIINFSFEVSTAILVEAGLAFLGLGDPNTMSLGYMLYNSVPFLRSAWWLSIIPGSAIFLIVLSLNLIGDGVNEALNPHIR